MIRRAEYDSEDLEIIQRTKGMCWRSNPISKEPITSDSIEKTLQDYVPGSVEHEGLTRALFSIHADSIMGGDYEATPEQSIILLGKMQKIVLEYIQLYGKPMRPYDIVFEKGSLYKGDNILPASRIAEQLSKVLN